MMPTAICWIGCDTSSMTKPLNRTPMISAPTIVLLILPRPPNSDAPPIDRGCDRLQLEALSGDRLRRHQARGEDESGDADAKTADHVDAEGHEADVDPGRPRRFAVAADGVDVAAEPGVAENERGGDGDQRQDDHRDGNAEQRSLPDDAIVGLQVVDRIDPVPDDEAAEGGERPERDDERIDACAGDHRAVQRSAEHADDDRKRERRRRR